MALIGTKMNKSTKDMLKNQRVPRVKYSDGIDLEIYKRCGWEPSKEGLSEKEEIDLRMSYVKKDASKNAMKVMKQLCYDYEKKYINY